MRSKGWRAGVVSAWVSTKQTARSKGSAGIMFAAALRQGLATPHGGAGDRGIELCKGARVLPRWHCTRRGTDSFCVHAHGSRSHPAQLATLQHEYQWLNSQILPFIIGGEATTHISQHIAPHRSVRIVVSTRLIQPKKKRVNELAEGLASGEAKRLQEAGA